MTQVRGMSQDVIRLCCAAVMSFTMASTAFAGDGPDLIFVGGTIYTLDRNTTGATAVAVKDGRVVAIGAADVLKLQDENTRLIDTRDLTVLPGLTDAHGHLRNLGRYRNNVQLIGSTSKQDVIERVRVFQKNVPADRWIRGRGWDQNDWDKKEFPTLTDLAGLDANPLYLRRVDGHACWVNQTALDLCGITRDTPDPEGGRIIRDSDGVPTGVFIDRATELITSQIPDPSEDELDEIMTAAIAECHRVGLVGVHDAGINMEMLASLRRIAARGALTLRVYCMLSGDDPEVLAAELPRGPRMEADGMLTIRAVKLYADGALGSRGARLLEAYSDDPGNIGLLVDGEAAMNRVTERAFAAEFQMCTHAIGDGGNRLVLDTYERVLGDDASSDHRFRIEHCQVVSLADIARFKQLGVIPSMQPTHVTSDMYWAEDRLGSERLKGAYAWRLFLEQGSPLVFGSDFPVESPNPFWGLYAAVTRQDHEHWPNGGWRPDQRVTLEEAMVAFTSAAAFASFAEKNHGRLAVGMSADFTIIDRDVFRADADALLETSVKMTVVSGNIVYDAR